MKDVQIWDLYSLNSLFNLLKQAKAKATFLIFSCVRIMFRLKRLNICFSILKHIRVNKKCILNQQYSVSYCFLSNMAYYKATKAFFILTLTRLDKIFPAMGVVHDVIVGEVITFYRSASFASIFTSFVVQALQSD